MKKLDADCTLLIAIHVHNAFANNPAPYINPQARKAADNIVTFGETLNNKKGVQTHCAFLCGRGEFPDPDTTLGGIYPPLRSSCIFNSYSWGYMESGFADETFIPYVNKKSTLILAGFNLNACVKENALDARVLGKGVIVVADCTANHVLRDDLENERREGIREMERAGVLFMDSYQVMEIIS